jgi:hypothetical protein
VDLTNGYFNCIWQGDANEIILRSLGLAASPPRPLNLTGPEVVSVRTTATQLGELMDKAVKFAGTESDTALLNNSAWVCQKFGPPPTPLPDMLRWTTHWVRRGGTSFNKPTHFEARDGNY